MALSKTKNWGRPGELKMLIRQGRGRKEQRDEQSWIPEIAEKTGPGKCARGVSFRPASDWLSARPLFVGAGAWH